LVPRQKAAPEPAEIAERRASLTQNIEAINAPRIRAREAYKQADGLIREIDAALSAKQTENLLKLGPSPIDLRLWPAAVLQITEKSQSLAGSVATGLEHPCCAR
jgi:small-conductance mechanosensitive channel